MSVDAYASMNSCQSRPKSLIVARSVPILRSRLPWSGNEAPRSVLGLSHFLCDPLLLRVVS